MATDKHTAWVIDDEVVNRALAGAFLRRMGWTVREMETPFEALQAAAQGLPELMVVDIRMPGMSGTELVSHLRQHFDTRDAHFVAYTAHCRAEEVPSLQGAGFQRVLLKPVSFQHMREAVDACCISAEH